MSKKVTVTYEDSDSLTNTEIAANLRRVHGENAEISITPLNSSPTSHIHFGISQLLTEEQALIFFDQPELYQNKLKTLRRETVKALLYILNDVIMENEDKFSS